MNNVTSQELLARYGAMLHLSHQMQESARRSEWDRLIEFEQTRSAIVDELRKIDDILWPAKDRERKAEIIRAILVIDAEVKTLTELWMGELRKSLGSIGTEQKLKKAYAAP